VPLDVAPVVVLDVAPAVTAVTAESVVAVDVDKVDEVFSSSQSVLSVDPTWNHLRMILLIRPPP
jgi:hypothetical protein